MEKYEQTKPKVNKRKRVKIRAEINEIETSKTINKINKITKVCLHWLRKKERHALIDIKGIIKDNYKFCANKLVNLDEMDKFQER